MPPLFATGALCDELPCWSQVLDVRPGGIHKKHVSPVSGEGRFTGPMRRRRGGPARVRRVEKRKDERLKKRREEKRVELLSGTRNDKKRDKKLRDAVWPVVMVKMKKDVEEMKVDTETKMKQSEKVEAKLEKPEIGLAVQGKAWCQEPVRQSWGPAGSFNRCLSAWEQLPGVSEQVLEWIRYGVGVEPGPSCEPKPWNLWSGSEFNVAVTEEEERWMMDEHRRWLSEGISERVGPEDKNGFWHPLKVAPKAGWELLPPELQWRKRFRLCLAVAKTLNKSLRIPRLKMETLEMALRLVQEGDCLVVGDQDSGYNHLLLRPESRRWFRYRIGGESFQMCVLFFGLASAPLVFSTTVSQLWKFLRRPQLTGVEPEVKQFGLRVTGFIDDLGVMERKDKLEVALKRWVWPVSGALGWCWGSKSDWVPSVKKKYLGLVVDAEARMVRLPEEKATQIRLAARYAKSKGVVEVLTVLRLIGRLRAASLAIPHAQLMAWELGRLVGPIVGRVIPDPWRLSPKRLKAAWGQILAEKVTFGEGALRALSWLATNVNTTTARSWDDKGVAWMVVDASPTRFGAQLGTRQASMPFPAWLVQELHGNQARREVAGTAGSVVTFADQLRGRRLGIMSDNAGQVSVMNSMQNGKLAPWVGQVLWFCVEQGIELRRASWIPSREMVRQGVDGLSRWVDANDWTIRDEVWSKLMEWAPEMEVDRFASSVNRRLPRWNSRFHEFGAEACDALVQDWSTSVSYACPPLALLGRVVELVRRQRASVVLVVPAWPGQIWWPMLLRLAPVEQDWLYLGTGAQIFQLGPSGKSAPMRRNWDFWAVKLGWMHGQRK